MNSVSELGLGKAETSGERVAGDEHQHGTLTDTSPVLTVHTVMVSDHDQSHKAAATGRWRILMSSHDLS